MLAAYQFDRESLMITLLPARRARAKSARSRTYNPPVKVPGGTSCLLSVPSKMPGLTWSLPAHQACPAAMVADITMPDGTVKVSICGHCYAAKGRYMQPCVIEAQRQRFAWAARCMRTPEGVTEFVDTLVAAIKLDRSGEYFRGHDSGDFFNPAYVWAWVRICSAMPDKRFWFPTRTWRFMDRPKWAPAILALAALPNVTMRPSALWFGDAAPRIPGMAHGSTAQKTGFNCPAPQQGNACDNVAPDGTVVSTCRKCWDAPDLDIIYRWH